MAKRFKTHTPRLLDTTKPRAARPLAFQSTKPRTFLGGVDAIQLSELLENHFDDNGGDDGSPYRRLYAQMLVKFLEPDPQAVQFAAVLEHVDCACVVEGAIRQAGFVLGFECCRQLLLGELAIPAVLKDGGK